MIASLPLNTKHATRKQGPKKMKMLCLFLSLLLHLVQQPVKFATAYDNAHYSLQYYSLPKQRLVLLTKQLKQTINLLLNLPCNSSVFLLIVLTELITAYYWATAYLMGCILDENLMANEVPICSILLAAIGFLVVFPCPSK